MIVAHIVGGLGNQMFQYAAARRLAWKHNTQLRLHLGEFEVYILHLYGLNHLNISAKEVEKKDLSVFFPQAPSFFPKKISSLLHRLPKKGRVIEERQLSFNPQVLSLPDNVYLRGYWQSEKYFSDCESIIRNEFQVKEPASKRNQQMQKKISNSHAVCVHVRRGDYVSNPVAHKAHGVCDLSYFLRAMEYMSAHVKKASYYVFSDDPVWAKKHIRSASPVDFIDWNGPEKNYEDLRLMTSCKHNIISNSTFSWWGAWLNENKEKIVVAPSTWFADASRDSRDIVPESWIRM